MLKSTGFKTYFAYNGYYRWKVIVGVQGKLRIF